MNIGLLKVHLWEIIKWKIYFGKIWMITRKPLVVLKNNLSWEGTNPNEKKKKKILRY